MDDLLKLSLPLMAPMYHDEAAAPQLFRKRRQVKFEETIDSDAAES
eukprot:CAMPEP_0175986436 /NCGR_PEP_ID=MMETSP0108-20121206/50146_1 /TAXON_ID=195067 ORGANISM="Goniomonas pacifica, Strain CCMP1869" /NCGR_SAMPLE_ID=MMETSP0108 /ASSEMBLY_ACC=CAM_ASM_000204 /LENGTH=45 /DNA_ID= /DNA_START= /DNA_END= /DNA_ORIENTATION=